MSNNRDNSWIDLISSLFSNQPERRRVRNNNRDHSFIFYLCFLCILALDQDERRRVHARSSSRQPDSSSPYQAAPHMESEFRGESPPDDRRPRLLLEEPPEAQPALELSSTGPGQIGPHQQTQSSYGGQVEEDLYPLLQRNKKKGRRRQT